MRKFLLLAVPIAGMAVFAGTHYLPGTHILGQNVFAMTPSQAEKASAEALKNRKFTLVTDGKTYSVGMNQFVSIDSEKVKESLHSTGDLTQKVASLKVAPWVKSLRQR